MCHPLPLSGKTTTTAQLVQKAEATLRRGAAAKCVSLCAFVRASEEDNVPMFWEYEGYKFRKELCSAVEAHSREEAAPACAQILFNRCTETDFLYFYCLYVGDNLSQVLFVCQKETTRGQRVKINELHVDCCINVRGYY